MKNNKLLVQILKFLVVGFSATFVDFFVANIFRFVLNFNETYAVMIGFIVALIFNYYLSKVWVFEFDNQKSSKQQFILFVVLSVIGFILNILIFELSVNILIFINNEALKFNISKVVATAIVMVYNFISRKVFLERKN